MRNDDETGATPLPDDDGVWETLVRFSREPLEPDDAVLLQHWVAEDPTRRDMVLAVRRLAAVARQHPPRARAAAAWARVQARVQGAMAGPEDRTPSHRPARVSGALRMVARREDARRWRWRVAQIVLAAGIVTLVVQRDAIVRHASARWGARVPTRELATGVGERLDARLDDGSTVTLAPQSRLRYGSMKEAGARTVELVGEAYFTVSPDPARPFTVLARHAAVQAVGTAFDVRAYAEDAIVQVVTTHGQIALRPRSAQGQLGTLVDSGQRGTLDGSGFTVVGDADLARATGWLHGRVSYDLVPLTALLHDLERRYDLDFELADTTLAAVRVTLTLDRASADDVVEQLAATLGVSCRREGRLVRIGQR